MALTQNKDQLCTSCQSMPLMKEVMEDQALPWGSLQQLISSALNGCYFCKYIYEVGFKTWMELNKDDAAKLLDAWMDIQWNGGYLPRGLRNSTSDSDELVLSLTGEEDYVGPLGGPSLEFSIFATPDESISSLIWSRPIHEDPVSDAAFANIQRWMDTCSDNHESCRHMTSPQLPRFIIHIQSSSDNASENFSSPKVQLVENNQSEHAPYIAFSYPWGVKTQPLQLMKSTMTEFKESIPYEPLPRAIKDVIRVAQGLEISYIWIDVLCIVQDDPQIKKQQIRDMKNIYGNSSLTVQALSIKSVHESFLSPRNNHSHKPLKLRYDENNHIYLRGYKMKNTPSGWTTNRAWMLEESVLPTKLLLYDVDQFSFRCEKLIYREDGNKLRFVPISNPSDWRESIRKRLNSPASPDRRLDFLSVWYGSLKDYTPRLLTDSHDRLPAIDGIAERLKPEIGGRYIAGIWESDLPWGLLWRSHNTTMSRLSPQKGWYRRILERPDQKRAPSWSWASVDGSIMHSFWVRHNDMIGRQTNVCSISIGHVEDDEDFADDIALSISAPVFQGYFHITSESELGRKLNPRDRNERRLAVRRETVEEELGEADQGPPRDFVAYAEFDIREEESQYRNTWVCALLLCSSTGLIVERAGERQGKEVYKRIGVFKVIPGFTSWCLEQPQQEILLV